MISICIGAAMLASFNASAFKPDSFTDTHDHKSFHLDGVDDFDQKRMAATVDVGGHKRSLLGLPGNGGEYCVPTSAVDWMAFLASRGIPGLEPGTGDMDASYTSGMSGFDTYNRVTKAIAHMGVLMQTKTKGGTGGAHGLLGALLYLIESGDPFIIVSLVEGNEYDYPLMYECLESSLNGSLVEPFGGWYHAQRYEGETVYTRHGGHATALAEASWDRATVDTMKIGLCNPADGDSDKTVQSPFAYTQYTVEGGDGVFGKDDSSGNVEPGSLHTKGFDWLNKDKKWILDGGLIFSPQMAYAFYGIEVRTGASRMIAHPDRDRNAVFTSADASPISSLSRSPLTGDLYYLTQQSGGAMFVLDPSSGDATKIEVSLQGMREVAFGSEIDPLVLFGTGGVAVVDRRGGKVSRQAELGFPIGQLAFNPHGNWMAAIGAGHKRYAMLNKRLEVMGFHPISSWPTGQGRVSAQFDRNDHLILFQPGDGRLYDNPPTGPADVRQLPGAVQDAESLAVDDRGRLYFSTPNGIVSLGPDLQPIKTPFDGLPGGTHLMMTRSVSNFDPRIHSAPEWWNDGKR